MSDNLTMYDSTNPDDIPGSAQAVLGYDDGSQSAWPAAAWERFAGLPQIHLSVDFDNDDGDGVDVELGNVNTTNDPRIRWKVSRLIAKGVARPWVYCEKSWWLGVFATLSGLPVRWLIADWTGEAHLIRQGDYIGNGHAPCDADGVQWASPSTGSGGHYDISVVKASAFGLAPDKPVPAPVVGTTYPEDKMKQYRMSVAIGNGRGWAPLPDGVDPGSTLPPMIFAQKPNTPGVGYRPYPSFAGIATGTEGTAELVFEPGGLGPAPDGVYGFILWVVTG